MSKPTIFVIDDDDSQNESLRSLVKSAGLNVEAYTSPQRFLESYRPDGPACLVLNVRLPEMSGIELQETLEERGITIPIIIIAAYGDVPTAVQEMKKRVADFIEKPFNPQALLDRIQQCLRRDAETRRNDALRDQIRTRLSTLTPREREVMDLIVEGNTNKRVGERLGISSKTVEVHRANMMQKMKVKTVAELVKAALTNEVLHEWGDGREWIEHALRQSKECCDLALEAIREAVYDWNIETGDIYCSPRVKVILGLSPKELRFVQDWLDRIHPDDADRYISTLIAHLKGKSERFQCEYRFRSKADEWRWARHHGIAIRTDKGRAYRMVGSIGDITESKQVEEALRKSEACYREMFETSPTGIWVEDYSAAKKIIDTFKRRGVRDFRKYFHKHPEKLSEAAASIKLNDVNQAVLDIRHAEDKDGFISAASEPGQRAMAGRFYEKKLAVLAEGETRVVIEEPITLNNGEEIVIRAITYIDDAYKDTWTRVISIEEDITERKQAEAALRESEKRFRGMFENTAIGTAITGKDERFQMVNRTLCKMFGYSEQELLTMSSLDVTHPDDREKSLERLRKLYSGEIGNYSVKKCYLRKDGNVMWGITSTSLISDSDGNPLYAIRHIQDITERKEAEETLRKNKLQIKKEHDQAQCYLDVSPVMFAVLDADGDITLINQKGCQVLGYEESEILNRNWFDLFIPEENREEIFGVFNKLMLGETDSVEDYENTLITKSGEKRTFSFHNTIIRDEESRISGILFSAEDITDRQETERILRQSQKMEAVGQLTGGIAHDFNNMLGVIMGNLEMLQRKVADDPKAMKYVKTAYEGCERGAKITRKLLRFSRKEVGKPQLTPVNELIEGMENLIAKFLTAKITVETHFANDPWSVYIDPGDFEDTLLNLALNARDAMPDGGALVIESANKVLDEHYAQHNPGSTAGEYVMVSVSDTGTGMTPEVVDKVFQPFFSTKDEGRGTGLGLSMVYGFIQRSGGRIKVFSEPGKGTTFYIFLPRATEGTNGIETADRVADDKPPRGDETILVVDDEQNLLKMTVLFLEDLGYRTLCAANGKQALEVLQEQKKIDLLFTDVVMPGGMDGYDLAKEVMKSYPGVKVLLTSGFSAKHENIVYGDKPLFEKLSRNLLSKPYNQAELAGAVRRTLDEQD